MSPAVGTFLVTKFPVLSHCCVLHEIRVLIMICHSKIDCRITSYSKSPLLSDSTNADTCEQWEVVEGKFLPDSYAILAGGEVILTRPHELCTGASWFEKEFFFLLKVHILSFSWLLLFSFLSCCLDWMA